jgi:type III restriction enzyme
MSSSSEHRLALATFQQGAVEGLKATIARVAEHFEERPAVRRKIALSEGVMLLQAPTGSGKTIMLGRTLEGLRGSLPHRLVWFWFAPYAGLVSQTRNALTEQCGSLRLRETSKDRGSISVRDGDVFVQTWASVAARNKEARKVRRSTEDALSLDDMLAELRDQGFHVGVVIDEAHLNFGASAKAAAQFYLDALKPDYTVLATATPNDEKLEQFEKVAKIEVASRIVIARGEVVEAGLNKRGLMVGLLKFQPGDEALIDIEQGTLQAGLSQHELIKKQLAKKNIAVTPLMLVQVEDQHVGTENPVARVKNKLIELGVPSEAIAVHTSGEPDPDFHTLAYDPSKEVLIFKVAVATGFDAPRAWTLVSVRPSRGKDFGLQIVGRIMRVHPSVRPFHGKDGLLDRGYVFLTDSTLQEGLNAAADELKAVRHSIELITDQLDLVQFGNTQSALGPGIQFRPMPSLPPPPASPEERQGRLLALVEAGFVRSEAAQLSPEEQDRAIEIGEAAASLGETPLFGELAEQMRPDDFSGANVIQKNTKLYKLKTELGIPDSLIHEVSPTPQELDEGLVEDVAREFCLDQSLMFEVHRRMRKATLNLRDLFLDEDREQGRDISLLMSNARIADKAQLAFQFNDSIDPRLLQRALVSALGTRCEQEGITATTSDLRRAIDLAVMKDPGRLKDAMRQALAKRVVMKRVPIPPEQFWVDGLPETKKSGYGVFPDRLNKEERAFAEFLDADATGTVKWWLRNPENELWATRLILPSGKRFFPDFAVGVTGRSTPDMVALVEIKDDGVTGRLQSDSNAEKIRVRHREYGQVFWSFRDGDQWVRARYADGLHRIVPEDKFRIAEMVYIG